MADLAVRDKPPLFAPEPAFAGRERPGLIEGSFGNLLSRMAQADNHVRAWPACRVYPDVMLGRQLAYGKIPAGVPAAQKRIPV